MDKMTPGPNLIIAVTELFVYFLNSTMLGCGTGPEEEEFMSKMFVLTTGRMAKVKV